MQVRRSLFIEHLAIIALLFASPFAVAEVQADANYRNMNVRRLIVETLLDTARNAPANGSTRLTKFDVEDRIVWDDLAGQRYVETFSYPKTGVRGEYRITLGMKGTADPRPPLWKFISNDLKNNIRVWSRPLKEGGTVYEQTLARKKHEGIVFDVFFTSPRSGAQSQAVGLLKKLIAKAEKNHLFSPEEISEPSPAGLWVGSMKNSKGGEAKSTLKLIEGKDGSISGVWHAGWKVSNVKRDGNKLEWEHKNVGGCRDYKNTLVISSSLSHAELHYEAYDRCNFPHEYKGQAKLARQLKN